MKHYFLLLFSILGFSQSQFKASDYGYSDDVVKVEESLYKFDKNQNKFSVETLYTTEVKDGFFQKQILESYFGENKLKGEYLFHYNADSSLKEINYTPLEGNFGYPIKFIYQHEKGKLIKVIVENMSTTFYEYDTNGNLVKEIVKDAYGEPAEIIFYQDYIGKKSYTKIKKSNDGSGNDFTKEIYKNGLLTESEYVSDGFKTITKYEYDTNRNVVLQNYNDSSKIVYSYEYDVKKNKVRVAKLSPDFSEDNSFTFIKITYADGTTSGSTELDLNFIKKHDKAFREKDSLVQQYQKVAYTRKDYLSVLKGEEGAIEIQDSYDNDFEKVVQLTDTPEHSSLVIFNEVDQSVHFVKGFYLDDFAKHEWQDAVKLESPTRIYWVKNNKFKISFYQDGKYLQSSNFSIENDENPNHLVVKSVEGSIYQIQNVDTSEAGRLYPLFKK